MAASNKPNSDIASELHGNKRSSKFGADEKVATSQKPKTALINKATSTDIRKSIFTALPNNATITTTTTSGTQANNTTISTGTQATETKTQDYDESTKSTGTTTTLTTETATITTQEREKPLAQPASAATTSTLSPASDIVKTLPTNQTSPDITSEASSAKTIKKDSRNLKIQATEKRINLLATKKISNTRSIHTNSSTCYFNKSHLSKSKSSKIKETIASSNTRSLIYFNSGLSNFKAKDRLAKRLQTKTSAATIAAATKEAKRKTSRTTISRGIKLDSRGRVPKSMKRAASLMSLKATPITEEVVATLTETTQTDVDTSSITPTTVPRTRSRPYSLIPIRCKNTSACNLADTYAKLKLILPTPMEEDSNNTDSNPSSKNNDSSSNNNSNNNDNDNENNNNAANSSETNTQNTNANDNGPADVANDRDTTNPSTSRTTPRKRKINEENAAKTSEAAAAAGPSTSTRATEEEEDKDKEEDKDAKKKKNRCAECRKKVGLTGFECRCGGLYCAVHRYSDKHDCTFNYREHGAQEIRRNNPVVVGEKIQKI